jgi:mannosyltransferase
MSNGGAVATPRAGAWAAELPYFWVVAGLTALAAILRFATLDVQSFYSDETVTAVLLQMDFGSMLDELSVSESAPPLYYVLAWAWGNVFGTGEVGLRSLSALIGTAIVPIAYLAGSCLASRRVGLIVAALAAVNPMLVWFSQEARVYSLFVVLASLSFLAFAYALAVPRPRAILLWGLASALALAAHYFAAFVIIPEAVLLLLAGRERRNVVIASLALAVVAIALLPLAVEQRDNGGTEWITDNPLAERVADTGAQYLVGPNVPAPVIFGPIAAALALFGLWLLFRRGGPPDHRAARISAIVGVTAIALPLTIALVGPDTFLQKTMIMAWLPLTLVVAIGFGVGRAGRAGVAAAAALCVLGIAVVVAVAASPTLQRDEWRGAAEAIDRSPDERLLVVNPAIAGEQHQEALQFYLPSIAAAPADARVRELQVLSLNDNGLDAQIRGVPELPEIPAPPGFEETAREEDDRFTLISFQASSEQPIPREWVEDVEEALEDADRGSTKLFVVPAGAGPDTG